MDFGSAPDRNLRARRWFAEATTVSAALLDSVRERQFLLVGTAASEPWHLTAHLHDAARAGAPWSTPILVRHQVPAGAPPHLAVTLDQLSLGERSATVLVVAPTAPDEELLERLADARRRGQTVFALNTHEPATGHDLLTVAHESLVVPAADFEIAQHVLPHVGLARLARWPRRRAGARPDSPSHAGRCADPIR